jgi:hypothetical protein
VALYLLRYPSMYYVFWNSAQNMISPLPPDVLRLLRFFEIFTAKKVDDVLFGKYIDNCGYGYRYTGRAAGAGQLA